jgi:ribosome-interacting GTPase 1
MEDVMVQLVDTPPITPDVLDPNTIGLIRGADLVLLLVDLGSDDGPDQSQEVIEKLNETRTRLADRTYLDEDDVGLAFTKTFRVANKCDLPEADDRLAVLHEFFPSDLTEFVISAEQNINLEPLRDAIYQSLNVVRVYTKSPAEKEPDYDRPYTIRNGGDAVGNCRADSQRFCRESEERTRVG